MVNQQIMSTLVNKAFEWDVFRHMGKEGLQALKLLGPFLTRFYKEKPPEAIHAGFVVLISEVSPDFLDPRAALTSRLEHLHQELRFPCVVQIISENKFLVWNCLAVTDQQMAASGLLYYTLSRNSEYLFAGGEKVALPNPQMNTRSIYSTPTFWEIEGVLRDYYHKVARISFDLEHLWVEQERLRWKAHPEHALRDSLWRAIRLCLRAGDAVKRERNTTDTNPVDIEVTWKESTAKCLIEIKWLGISVEAGKITSDHAEGRAVEGAWQLQQYVSDSKKEDVDSEYVGYLVVFDGRRAKVRKLLAQVSREDAWAYRDREVTYPDPILQDRRLSVQGFRFFMEPAV